MSIFKRGKLYQGVALSSLLIAGLGAPTVAAQNDTELDEIIVTATKRDERLRDVPMAISVLGEDALEIAGITDSQGIADTIPGMTFSTAGNNINPSFIVRGIGTLLNQDDLTSPVAVYLDEMPMSAAKSTVRMDFGLFDAARVEVLKGPQGTLFGAGTLAGAVRIISNKPDPSGLSYKISTDIGSTSGELRQRYNAMVNIPISENAAVRLVAFAAEDDGWVNNLSDGTNPTNGMTNTGLRALLGWQVNDRFNANFSYMFQDTEIDDGSTINPALGENSRTGFAKDSSDVEMSMLNMTLEYDLGFATLTSSTNYSENDAVMKADLSPIIGGAAPWLLHREPSDEAFAQEIRLVSSSDSRLDWVLGGFLLDRQTEVAQVFYLPQSWVDARGTGPIGGAISTMTVDNAWIYGGDVTHEYKETAFFGELGYQLTDTIKATVGFRTGDMENSNSRPGGGASSFGPVGSVIFGGATSFEPVPYTAASYEPGKTSSNNVKLSLAWQFNDNVNFYATASEGFRTNEINRAGFLPGLDGQLGSSRLNPDSTVVIQQVSSPDSLWNYEVGMKAQWDSVTANLTFYNMVWEDIQLSAMRPGEPDQFITNAGEAKSDGIELEILADIGDNLELGVNVAVQDARITQLSEQEAILTGAAMGSSLVSPDLQLSGHFKYTVPLDSGNEAFARMGFSYTDELPNGFPNNVGTPGILNPFYAETDAWTKVDFILGWASDKWSVALYGENILDNDDSTFIMQQNFFANKHMTPRPRTFGIRVSMNP
ncbi:MAG: TonB-dependent receptor [Porticoccaceae bacterium]|nr:TonB-dependent receptor [Porticoccaceae bacterium]